MTTRSLRPGAAAAGLAALLAVAAGCGTAEPKRTTVSGTVTYKGQPVTGGTITFVAGPGVSGGGLIRGDGTFFASGVPVGKVKVAVQTSGLKTSAATPTAPAGTGDSANKAGSVPDWVTKTGGPTTGVPTKYVELPVDYESADSSGIEVTVEESKALTVTLE